MGMEYVAVFVASNLLIFGAYAWIGAKHFCSHREPGHYLYGLFITACGLGHLIMAWHMIESAPFALVASHAFTAFVSVLTCFHREK